MVVSATTGRIFFKKMTDQMPRYFHAVLHKNYAPSNNLHRYPFFLVLFITAIAVPFYFIVLLVKTYQYKRKGETLYARYLAAASIQTASANSDASAESSSPESSLMLSVKRYTHAHRFSKLKLALSTSAENIVVRFAPRLPYFLVLVGFLDSCASNLMVFGGHGTSGPLQALLSQGVIPIVLVLSMIFMKARYSWNQYLGAFLVLGAPFSTEHFAEVSD